MDDDGLVDEAVELLPRIGKLLYVGVMSHPAAMGLSFGQIKALAHLYHGGRSTVGEVAGGLGVAMATASELIDKLVERGLVERGVNPTDRRQVHVWLTDEAMTYGHQIHALRRAQVRAALDRLAPAERPVFVRSLRALAEALRESATGQAAGCPIGESSAEPPALTRPASW